MIKNSRQIERYDILKHNQGDEQMNSWIDGQMDIWIDGQIENRGIDGKKIDGLIDG